MTGRRPGRARRTTQKNADRAVVLLNPHPLTDAAAAMCGAPIRIGYKAALKSSLTDASGLEQG